MKNKYHIIGLMSGTSLDGLDLVYCTFHSSPINYKIIFSESYPYSKKIKSRLQKADGINAYELAQLDADISKLFAQLIKDFIEKHSITEIDAISSHGHTVFHQPQHGFTLQIGKPSYIAALTGHKLIGDFRSADIALGGQGAPLVPIGDRDLFSMYKNRINLGGFANISFEKKGETLAYDICPLNMPLNKLASHLELEYDSEGEIARTGEISFDLLSKLNGIEYYQLTGPKSLGKEWFDNEFYPIVENAKIPIKDKLRTIVEHTAMQINLAMIEGNCLVSGGGSYNLFLIERIEQISKKSIIIPENTIIDFKEALLFAYLGYLRLLNKSNVLKSVTGSYKNHSAGVIHLP